MEMGSSSSSSSSNSPESLNGLKFGQKIYFEDVGVGVPAKSGGGLSSSGGGLPPPAPSKKGRVGGVVQGGGTPRCQVEGCNVDLSDAKAYYSRHKVCGMHSKSPMVIVGGLEQRFCQQCSRFHQLPEFDQEKRSCRRRLAGHNERRRKPPPGSLLSTRYGSVSSSIFENNSRAGGFLMDFTTYPRHQPTAIGKFLPHPWQSNSENPPPDFLQSSANRTSYNPGPVIPPGGCFTDSNCALSLLSNQPSVSRTQPSSLGPNYLLNSDGANMIQPPVNHFLTTSWSGFKGGEAGTSNQFSSTPWGGFKGNEASGGSHEMHHPGLGLGQFLQQPADGGSYSGELELAQQSGRQYMELEHPRAYDSSDQHIHWSL